MINLEPFELLLLLVVAVAIPATVGLGLYWVIRKAVADGRRDAQRAEDSMAHPHTH